MCQKTAKKKGRCSSTYTEIRRSFLCPDSVKSVEPKNESRGPSHLLGLKGKEARLRLPFFQAPELLPRGHGRSYGSWQSQEARRTFLPCWRGGRRLSASSSTKVRDAHSNRRSLASRIRRSVRSQL